MAASAARLFYYLQSWDQCSTSAVSQAALGAGMRCIITYTGSTKDEAFDGAERILQGLSVDHATLKVLSQGGPVFDDRVALASTAVK